MPALKKILSATSIFICSIGLGASNPALAECGPDTTADKLSECAPHETLRVPFSVINESIRRGDDPPKEWQRMGGAGAVNTGGVGDLGIGGLNDPTMPDSGSAALAASGGGAPTFTFPSGPATSQPPNCGSYKSPRLADATDLLGETEPLGSSDKYSCGYATTLEHDWATLSPGATYAAITTTDSNKLQIYSKQQAELIFRRNIDMPEFYCELRERIEVNQDGISIKTIWAEKIPISLEQHYAEINANTRHIALAIKHATGTIAPGAIENGFMIATHEGGGQFKPPAPDPIWFTSRGATSVDPKCYSLGQLIRQDIPDGFGSIMFGHRPLEGAAAGTINPHSFLEEPERCEPFLQYYDGHLNSFYVPPDSQSSSGDIRGGNPYSRKTIRTVDGHYATTGGNSVYYNGPMIYVNDVDVYLGTKADNINVQGFPAGAIFTINSTRQLRIPPPGRVKLYGDYRMQLLDGGYIEDNYGDTINVVNSSAYVQFKHNETIVGRVDGSLVSPEGSTIPTNSNGEMRLPYDLRLNQVCE